MTFRHCVAVDLGASSGRVMLARYDSKHRTLTLREIHRFVNCLQKTDGFKHLGHRQSGKGYPSWSEESLQ